VERWIAYASTTVVSVLDREQEGGEERALNEFLEDVLGQPHESHPKAMALVHTANRLDHEVIED
jgi:hypothetical protein